MKELIEALEKSTEIDYLIDTCFLIDIFHKNKTKDLINFCINNRVGITSFNFDELLHIHYKFPGHVNHQIRGFLKQKKIYMIEINVEPGQYEQERKFVEAFDSEILKIIHDPSDAVLFVAGLKLRAHILTKDKHHIFRAAAENFSHKYGIEIYKELP